MVDHRGLKFETLLAISNGKVWNLITISTNLSLVLGLHNLNQIHSQVQTCVHGKPLTLQTSPFNYPSIDTGQS